MNQSSNRAAERNLRRRAAPRRLKSGADKRNLYGASVARRDFRPTKEMSRSSFLPLRGPIDLINQLSHPAEIPAVWTASQSWQMQRIRLVLLRFQRARNHQRTLLEKIDKLVVQPLNGLISQLSLQPEHELLPNPAVGMKIPVESNDLFYGDAYIIRNAEQMKIIPRNQTLLQEMVVKEINPSFPIASTGFINQDHRDDPCFPRLHQGQALETLIHRPKPAREQGYGVAFFQEVEFPCKEVVEIHELRIAVDDLVGPLFERQPNIQAKAVLAARPPLS